MLDALTQLITSTHERWRQGAEDFERLSRSNPSQLPRRTTVRSAIYGNMVFEPDEMRFIESFYLQRLRHVSQMGLLYQVYPDARHSRFEHSLGVLHSLKNLLEADPQVKQALTKDQRRTLYLAALLHDCGHGPFSHTTESLLHLSGLDLTFRRPGPDEVGVKPHERRCRDMIHDSDFHLANLAIPSYGLKTMLSAVNVDASAVSSIVLGSRATPLLNLLSGDFDVDKMDYFRRDAFFTGTMGGGVDMEAIQRWVRIINRDGYPVAAYDNRLVGHLLHLLYSREHVYSVTAYHPVARIAAALILVSGDLALRALPAESSALLFSNVELLDDREFIAALEIAARDAQDKEEGALLRRTVQRLYLRRLPKRIATLSRRQFLQTFAPALETLEADKKELPELAYCRISHIANGKYQPLLGGGGGRDDVAILEMSPQIGGASDRFDSANAKDSPLWRILITKSGSGEPVPLAEWLDDNAGAGAAAAQAMALRAYKLSIWKALVLVPASLKIALTNRGETAAFLSDFAASLANPTACRPLRSANESWAPALSMIAARVKGWREERAPIV